MYIRAEVQSTGRPKELAQGVLGVGPRVGSHLGLVCAVALMIDLRVASCPMVISCRRAVKREISLYRCMMRTGLSDSSSWIVSSVR